jgi:hypothetical protein
LRVTQGWVFIRVKMMMSFTEIRPFQTELELPANFLISIKSMGIQTLVEELGSSLYEPAVHTSHIPFSLLSLWTYFLYCRLHLKVMATSFLVSGKAAEHSSDSHKLRLDCLSSNTNFTTFWLWAF